jgi:hypothetical protein
VGTRFKPDPLESERKVANARARVYWMGPHR